MHTLLHFYYAHIHIHMWFWHFICFCIGDSFKRKNYYNEILEVKWDVYLNVNTIQYKFMFQKSKCKE